MVYVLMEEIKFHVDYKQWFEDLSDFLSECRAELGFLTKRLKFWAGLTKTKPTRPVNFFPCLPSSFRFIESVESTPRDFWLLIRGRGGGRNGWVFPWKTYWERWWPNSWRLASDYGTALGDGLKTFIPYVVAIKIVYRLFFFI